MSEANLNIGRIGDSVDFCQGFSMDIDALYSLALLLTGDLAAAETCLLAGLESCLSGRPLPEHSARSWSRWSVICEAAKAVSSRPDFAPAQVSNPLDASHNPMILAISRLPVLDRFAFVVTVLERYSVTECATLLHCQSRDVIRARVRAMQAISAGLQALPSTSDAEVEAAAMVAA